MGEKQRNKEEGEGLVRERGKKKQGEKGGFVGEIEQGEEEEGEGVLEEGGGSRGVLKNYLF